MTFIRDGRFVSLVGTLLVGLLLAGTLGCGVVDDNDDPPEEDEIPEPPPRPGVSDATVDGTAWML